MIIKDFPAFAFPPLRDCARCGRTVQADECGLPCNPDHPFYNRWICDDCLDQIAAQSEEEKSMTLEKFFEVLDKLPREDYIVRMAAWYDHDPKPHQGELFNEILEYDGNEDQYVWLNDWYEGQQNITVIGFVAVSEIPVPVCDDYLSTFGGGLKND